MTHKIMLATGTALLLQASLSLDPALAQVNPAAYTTGYRYDAAHQVVGIISPDPDGSGPLGFLATRNTYDAGGRLIKAESGSLSTWQDQTVAPSSWAGFTVYKTQYLSYDALDHVILERYAGSDGAVQNVTQFSYDSMGRLSCSAVRMNSAIFSALPSDACALGTLGSDGPDRVTHNVYDAAGQLAKIQRGYGTALQQDYATYTYTPNGKRGSVKDARGYLASMSYDGFDRQSQWNFPSSSATGTLNPSDYESYGYDADDNRTSLRKRDGSVVTYQYDALDRVTVKLVPQRSGLPATDARSVYYGYDLLGDQTFARFDSATGEGVGSSYDNGGRLILSASTMDGVSRSLSYQYDADGNRTRLTFPDGNYVTYSYDGLDRPSLIQRSGTATIASYNYDQAGRRNGFNGGASTSYGYDPAGRLSSLTNNVTASGYSNQYSASYNAGNQIKQLGRTNDAFAFVGGYNVNRGYSANGLNQYTAAGGATFAFDPNGDLTGDGSTTYLYDIENRLVSTSGANNASLRYDPMGRLYEIVASSGAKTRFLYDGDAMVAEYDGTGALQRRYVHGGDLDADDPVAWYEGATFAAPSERLLRSDWHGSVVLLTNTDGSSVYGTNSYDEYGIPGSSNLGRFQYTGQAWEPEVGLYYYKARMYSPTLGRFLQVDPIGYQDQINLYGYVGNDPIDHADPTGEVALSCLLSGDTHTGSCAFADDGDSKHVNINLTYSKTVNGTLQTNTSRNSYSAESIAYSQAYGAGIASAAKAQANGAFGINLKFTSEPQLEFTTAPSFGSIMSGAVNSILASLGAGLPSGPLYKTENEARSAAATHGWRETNLMSPGRRGKFYRDDAGNLWTRDRDGHNGGAWKMYDRTGTQRLGTYDENLSKIKE